MAKQQKCEEKRGRCSPYTQVVKRYEFKKKKKTKDKLLQTSKLGATRAPEHNKTKYKNNLKINFIIPIFFTTFFLSVAATYRKIGRFSQRLSQNTTTPLTTPLTILLTHHTYVALPTQTQVAEFILRQAISTYTSFLSLSSPLLILLLILASIDYEDGDQASSGSASTKIPRMSIYIVTCSTTINM